MRNGDDVQGSGELSAWPALPDRRRWSWVTAGPRLDAGLGGRLAFDRLLLAGTVLLAFLLLGPLLLIPRHIPLNYNEGWNAYFATRAVVAGTGPLYPPPDSLVFNNYPPLSFYVVGAFGRWVTGDMIVAGRIVSLLSLLASAALLGVCVVRLGASRRAGLAASLLLLLFAATFYREYVAMDDPQWLAHALMLAGLAVLLRGQASGMLPARDVVAAALLVLAGGCVKHSLVALPLSVTVWLACLHRRAALVWLAAAAAGLGVGLLGTGLLHGHDAFADVLQHHRVFRLRRLTKAIGRLAPLLPMALAAGAVLCRPGRRDPALLFAALFVASSTVVGVVQRIGEGVYYNAHFETLIALCLAMGLSLSRVAAMPLRVGGRALGPASLAAFAAIPVLVMSPWHMPHAWADIAGGAARERSWRPVIERLAAAPGPVACEMLSLCYWAGKPFEIDLFNLTQSVLVGGPTDALQALADHRTLGMFQFTPRSFIHADAQQWVGRNPVMDRFAAGYAAVAAGPDGTILLAPRVPETR